MYVACMEASRGLYKTLVVKSEGERPLGTSRIRLENNIKMELQKVECGLIWLRIGTGGGHL